MTISEKKKPTWTDLKRNLADLDQHALLGLVQDLYAASKENKAFLHARFGLGDDVLEPYKAIISRWVCPDVNRNQDFQFPKPRRRSLIIKMPLDMPSGWPSCRCFIANPAGISSDFAA